MASTKTDLNLDNMKEKSLTELKELQEYFSIQHALMESEITRLNNQANHYKELKELLGNEIELRSEDVEKKSEFQKEIEKDLIKEKLIQDGQMWITPDAITKLQEIVLEYASKVSEVAVNLAGTAGRKTVKEEDIEQADKKIRPPSLS